QHKKVRAVAASQNVSSPSSSDAYDDSGQSTSASQLIQPFQKHLNLGGDVEEETENLNGPDPPANLDVSMGPDFGGHEKAEDFSLENNSGEHDRMGEDGYPLVVDLGTSERQSRLARQRLIDEVIQDQAFDQDVIEELERANMRRVFEEIEEGEDAEHAAMRRRATANGIV
ncbi:hypothetical protein COOONC_21533, partial [Cooperia oncophora]